MASKLLDKAQKFYKIGLKNINLQLKLNGTQFVVLRPKDNSKWKNVFGGSYSSSSILENDYEQLSCTLVINMSDMRDVWNRNRDTLDAWSNDGTLQLGDELQFTKEGRTYRFKISQKMGLTETADSLFYYALMSIIETLDT